MRTFLKFHFLLLAIVLISNSAQAQDQLTQDYSKTLEIDEIKAIEASSSHLYVLSETDGMAVFRAYEDSLQWLYTSSGMQRRGDVIESDIRFAYLYGNSRRLTILEPTSVLGVYSSTLLPVRPFGVARLDNELYVALGDKGLGRLILDTPETVDTNAEIVENETLGRASVLDVTSSIISNQLFVLTDNSRLFVYTKDENGLELVSNVELDVPLSHLFIDEEQLWGSTTRGQVYRLNANGIGQNIGTIGEPVSKLITWNNYTFVRGRSGKLWVSGSGSSLRPWKEDASAGNHIAKSNQTIWNTSYNKLNPLKVSSGNTGQAVSQSSGRLDIKDIDNIILTYPKPLLLAVELENGIPDNDVEFTFRSSVKNAQLKKQGFYWQPSVNQVGFNWFTIIATNAKGEIDSTRFSVDVRTFNSPPRFSPVRNSSIGMNDPYEVKFNAVDPENPSSSLIRYLGVDLPDGATVDERTGLFKWTPNARQVGEHSFRIIATDEQGAAASQDVTLTVLDISREGN